MYKIEKLTVKNRCEILVGSEKFNNSCEEY